MLTKREKQDYLCKFCSHCGLCIYEQEYKKAQDKVDAGLHDILVGTSFVKPVRLDCKFYNFAIGRPK